MNTNDKLNFYKPFIVKLQWANHFRENANKFVYTTSTFAYLEYKLNLFNNMKF